MQGMFAFGNMYTWTAMDSETKLLCSWMIGERSAETASYFMRDLATRHDNDATD